MSGPLLDRIDIVVEVPIETQRAERLWQRQIAADRGTELVRGRVGGAREFAHGARSACEPNVRLSGVELESACRLAPEADRLLRDAVERWSLSARAAHRTLRVARTIANLAGRDEIAIEPVAEALSMRHETLRTPG